MGVIPELKRLLKTYHLLPFCAAVVFISYLLTAPYCRAGGFIADHNAPVKKTASWGERKIEGPIDIEADRLEYDREKDSYHAFGNVIINFTNGFLLADAVTVSRKTGDAEASGEVYISDAGDTLEGNRVAFNLNTKTGITHNGKVFLSENNVYLTGSTIEKRGEQTYFLQEATATTCDGERPAWRFTAQELDVTIEGYGTLKHGTFQVKNFPLLYAPYMIFPAKTKRQTGFLLPSLSYSDLNGFDLEVPFFWAVSENSDATFYQRYMSKRGYKQGLEYRYYLGKDTFGTFYGDYLYDNKEVHGAEDGLFRDWRDSRHRWSYYLNHQTVFSPGFYFRTDLAKVSDHWYFRDFSNYNYYLDNYSPTTLPDFQRISFLGDRSLATLDSTARIVKDWPLYNLTVLTRYTDNLSLSSNDTTLQYYPQVTFTGIRQPLFGTPVNFELASSYVHAYRNEGQKGHVADISPTLSLPLNFGDYLQMLPSVGFSETAWDVNDGSDKNRASRELFTLGLYGTTEVYRVFSVPVGTLDKIRHGIRPEVTYTYRPHAAQNVPDFVAVLPEKNSITYALTNTLTAKLKEKIGFSYLEFLRLKVQQTYNIEENRSAKPEEDTRHFSPIDIETDILPSKYFGMRSIMSIDPNDGEWKRLNYDIAVDSGFGQNLTLGYRYTQDILEEINLGLKARWNKNIDLMYVLRQNLFDKKTLESSYGVDYHQQCWAIQLSYSELDNDRRVMVNFALFGLGKVGSVEARPSQLLGRTESTTVK